MSINDLGKPIGLGRTAEVYAWKAGYVLKLFHQVIPLQTIEHEARMARIVQQAGLPAPAVQDIVHHADRYGLVYERVLSVSMLQTLAAQPWTLWRFARLLAELQVRLNQIGAIPGLPVQRHRLRNKILAAAVLSHDLQQTALNMLETLPLGHYLCHGDFHPGNVLVTDKGPIIIDWIDATCGRPLADVARSSLLLQMAALPQKSPGRWLPQLGRQWFHRLYLRRYLQLCPGDERELARWRLVSAAARLSDNVPERRALLAFVQAGFSGSV